MSKVSGKGVRAPLWREAPLLSIIEFTLKLTQRADSFNFVVVVVGDPPLDHSAPRDEHSGQPAKG